MNSFQRFVAGSMVTFSLLTPALSFAESGLSVDLSLDTAVSTQASTGTSASSNASANSNTDASSNTSASNEASVQSNANAQSAVNLGVLSSLKARLQSFFDAKIHREGGLNLSRRNVLKGLVTITALSDSSVTIKDETGASMTFDLDDSARLTLLFMGKAELNDFHVGDRVRVVAEKDDSGNWDVKKMQNVSVRRVTIRGTVKSVSANGFELESGRFDSVLNVSLDADSEIFLVPGHRRGPRTEASQSDVKAGSTVLVKGILIQNTNALDGNVVMVFDAESKADPKASTKSEGKPASTQMIDAGL